MKFDELFEQRSLVASKLKDCIRDMVYTKVSFAAKADISTRYNKDSPTSIGGEMNCKQENERQWWAERNRYPPLT